MNSHFRSAAVVLVAALLATGCNDGTAPGGNAEADKVPAPTAQPDVAAQRRANPVRYQVRLEPLGENTAHGVVVIKIVNGYLTVTAHAQGLDPSQHIPQHIHLNPECAVGGAVLLNLDANLTVAGEAPSVGDAFPVANRRGALKYRARRSLSDLLQAVNTYRGTNLTSVEELLAWLDLDNRNVHMHISAPPYTPVTCGLVERLH